MVVTTAPMQTSLLLILARVYFKYECKDGGSDTHVYDDSYHFYQRIGYFRILESEFLTEFSDYIGNGECNQENEGKIQVLLRKKVSGF